MFPSAIRQASRTRMAMRPMARPMPVQGGMAVRRQALQMQMRANSTQASAGAAAQNNGMYIVLGYLVALTVGGYVFLRPIREAAVKMNTLADQAKTAGDSIIGNAQKAGQMAAQAGKKAANVAGDVAQDAMADGDLMGLAKQYLPGLGAAVLGGGGLGGILSQVKPDDLTKTLDLLKKHGGDEVARVVDIVQKKIADADGKISNVDFKSLAQELSKELPKSYQSTIDSLVGKIPSAEDFNEMAEKLKKEGKDAAKDLEKSAEKVYKSIQKASKDGKSGADAFVVGIKEAAPDDIEGLVKSVKDMLRSAGLPADTIVNYAVDKAQDGAEYAEEYAREFQTRFNQLAKWLPVDEDQAVKTVSSVSPALGNIVKELLNESKEQAGKASDAVAKGKKELDDAAKKIKKA